MAVLPLGPFNLFSPPPSPLRRERGWESTCSGHAGGNIPDVCVLGVWETLSKGGGLRPTAFKRISKAPGAGHIPKIGHSRVRGGGVSNL